MSEQPKKYACEYCGGPLRIECSMEAVFGYPVQENGREDADLGELLHSPAACVFPADGASPEVYCMSCERLSKKYTVVCAMDSFFKVYEHKGVKGE